MKLKCNRIQCLISDYIDDLLSVDDAAKVDAHIKFCRKCEREIAALKKTRDLVVDYYVEPVASDNYLREFEVELNRSIEQKGPTPLYERFKTSVAQCLWCLLTRLRQSFSRYSDTRINALSVSLLLLLGAGLVVTHLFNQEVFTPYEENTSNTPGLHVSIGDTDNIDDNMKLLHEHRTNRKDPSEVSSPAQTAYVEKVGYWKLSEPLSTDAEEYLIVMHIGNDRSVPSDTDSEMIVYEQPEIINRKSPIQGDDYVAHPLELQVTPFAEKHPRKQRKLSGFVVKLMHVPKEMLTIPEFYGLIKL